MKIQNLMGDVEMDEAYIIAGEKGIKKNPNSDDPPRKRALKKPGRGTYDTDKPPVTTFVHRESTFTIFSVEKNLSKNLISKSMDNYINNEATIYTDEYSIYTGINKHQKINGHYTVNHSEKEYVNGNVHVNNCENRHSLLRPFLRIFRGVSKRFLAGYIMVFQYLFNYKEDAPDKILQTIFKNVIC
ncbi:MAG: IS1595 family transposase [Methanobrevibacter sp.]|nr:IS1595 family transposase [Candidatus Methanovirga australis]